MQFFFEMIEIFDSSELLAQLGDPPKTEPGGGETDEGGKSGSMFGGMLPFLLMMFGVMFVFMLFSSRPKKKEQARRQGMLDNLKKSDKILTAGGIVGYVANIEKDKDFVTIRIDEANNTKLKVLRSSIARVLTEDDKKGIESEK